MHSQSETMRSSLRHPDMPNNINGATILEAEEDLDDMNSFYDRYPPKQDPEPLEVREREGRRLISNELHEIIMISKYNTRSYMFREHHP